MTDANQSLETFEEGGSVTAGKMRTAASKIRPPKKENELLSPHRDNPDS